MGKGDKRSRRGKIFAGSYGKSRPKPKKANTPAMAAGQPEAETKPKGRKKKEA